MPRLVTFPIGGLLDKVRPAPSSLAVPQMTSFVGSRDHDACTKNLDRALCAGQDLRSCRCRNIDDYQNCGWPLPQCP